ncbi:MAG: hypothetical protein CMC15_02950, partial [Flavobacteriaceae bacterium]|nr:hypothetical protein [Flavobacteriaceae bacterium]
MQNKGLITVFAILFGLVSLYQLSYTYIATGVEDDAKEYARAKYPDTEPEMRANAETKYLDSVNNVPQMLGI